MIDQLNKNTFLLINHLANKAVWSDQLAIVVAEYLPFVFIAVLIFLWLSNKGDYRNNALYGGYASVLGITLNFLISSLYFHPRPFMDNIGIALINHVPEASFPSDHTTFMLSISIALLWLKDTRKIGVVLSLLGFVGGLSRVLCGIHYPFDILGSLIVATCSGIIIISLKRNLKNINQFLISQYSRIINEKS